MDLTPSPTCLEKQAKLKKIFQNLSSKESRYEKIISMGKLLPYYSEELKTTHCLVSGCQSLLYLHAELKENKVHFSAYSDSLISAGLAALLLEVYNDEPPEALFTCPPHFLVEIGISASLSPSRSNGLSSLFKTMQQRCLNFLSV